MAQAKDPVNPSRQDSADPEAPRFLDGEARVAAPAQDPQAPQAARPRIADYAKASPEDIAADIERTRAHMDETLHQLSQRLKPRMPGRKAIAALGFAALCVLAYLGVAGYRGYRRSHSLRGRLAGSTRKGKQRLDAMRQSSVSWRHAGLGEQSLLAAKLALAVRKGKPAIIVVEPRQI